MNDTLVKTKPNGAIVIDPQRAGLDDAIALAALDESCFETGVAFTRRQFRRLLTSPTSEVWLCRHQDQLVADAVVLWRRTQRGLIGRLYSLAVDPSHRGQGLGRAMLQHCLEHFRRQNAYAVVLEVSAHNQSAISLYLSEGFQHTSLLPDYYAPGESACRMKKLLPPNR